MAQWAIPYLTLAVMLLSVGGSVWVFLRSGGVVDRLLKMRDSELRSLSESLEKLSARIAETERLTNLYDVRVQELSDSFDRRIGSFESRYGKAQKKEELEALKKELIMSAQPGNPGLFDFQNNPNHGG